MAEDDSSCSSDEDEDKKVTTTRDKCEFNTELTEKLIQAIITGEGDVIIKALMVLPDVNPSAYNNMALSMACSHGKLKIVQMLLEDTRVMHVLEFDFTNRALRFALIFGQVHVFKYLLENTSVNFANELTIAVVEKADKKKFKQVLDEYNTKSKNNNATRGLASPLLPTTTSYCTECHKKKYP